MDKYQILRKGVFENVSKFESKINEMAAQRWRVVNLTNDGTHLVALMERQTR